MMRSTVDGLIASQTASGLFPYGFDFLADKPLRAWPRIAGEPDPPGRDSVSAGSVLPAHARSTLARASRSGSWRPSAAIRCPSASRGCSAGSRARICFRSRYGRWTLQTALLRHGLLYETAGERQRHQQQREVRDCRGGNGRAGAARRVALRGRQRRRPLRGAAAVLAERAARPPDPGRRIPLAADVDRRFAFLQRRGMAGTRGLPRPAPGRRNRRHGAPRSRPRDDRALFAAARSEFLPVGARWRPRSATR